MPLQKDEKRALLKFINDNHLKIDHHTGWENFSRNLHFKDALVLDVQDTRSLQQLLKKIYLMNQNKPPEKRILLRATAGGRGGEYSQSFSFTEGTHGDVIVRLVGEDFLQIKPTDTPNVICAGGSVQIGTLDQKLYEDFNLSVPTSSLIPFVTVAGLSANAGHGTGKDQPSFAGLVRAMTLCLPNGDIVRIDKSHPDFDVIRGANLGLFGIMLNAEIECISAKKLQCVMEARSLPDFLDEVKQGLFQNDPYVSAMYVPSYQPDELTSRKFKNVIVYRWRPVDKSNPDVNYHPFFSDVVQQFEVSLGQGLHVKDFLRQFPCLIPYYNKYLVAKFSIGCHDTISVAPWPSVHYQQAYPWGIDDADYLFQTCKDGCDEMVSAMERIASTLTGFASGKKYPIIDAVYLRLFQGTDGGLSTSTHLQGNFVCGLDMVSSRGISGYPEFKAEMRNYFINALHAKPHWGKYVPEDLDYAKIYGPDFTQFRNTLNNWYKQHNMGLDRCMLLNSFFCNILQLPQYAPAVSQHAAVVNTAVMHVFSASEMADKMIAKIHEKIPEAEELKQELEKIKYSESKVVLFQPLKVEEKKKVKKEKCCMGCFG